MRSFDYDIALANMNTSVYAPRGVYSGMLRKTNDIAVDTSALSGPRGMLIPDAGEDCPVHFAALWVSAKINGARLHKNDMAFLGDRPSLAFRSETRGSRSLYDAVDSLNSLSQDFGFVYTLQLVDKWESVLLALMEGYTVMVGGSVYEGFDSALSGSIVRMPKPGEALLGGHIVNLISFDQKEDLGVAIGNLGITVGRRGLLKYRGSYFRNLAICRDFYVLTPRYEHAN